MNKFTKSERLCSRKSIERLFSKGNILFHYPFKMVWMDSESEEHGPFPVKIAIAVPARRIRKAVRRNRIRRLIRESYRRCRNILYESPAMEKRKIDMVLIYVSENVYDYAFINLKLNELINKFTGSNASGKDIL